jgi:hypothetical protein
MVYLRGVGGDIVPSPTGAPVGVLVYLSSLQPPPTDEKTKAKGVDTASPQVHRSIKKS